MTHNVSKSVLRIKWFKNVQDTFHTVHNAQFISHGVTPKPTSVKSVEISTGVHV